MGSVETLSSFLVSSFVSTTAATAATSFFSSCLGWKEAMTFVVKIVVVIIREFFWKNVSIYWFECWFESYGYREDNNREI